MNTYSLLFFGIVVCVVAMLLKEIKSSYGWLCILVGAIVILLFALREFDKINTLISSLQTKANMPGEYIGIIFRVLGICILGDLSISLCNDAHHSTLASALEMMCKFSIIVLSLPIFEDVLNIIGELLG